MLVFPVINCLDLECVVKTLHKIERFLPEDGWIHLDIADGRFTFHKTWNDPEMWPKLKCSHSLEVHLMVEEPEKIVDDWLRAGAKRLILHYESISEGGSHIPHAPGERIKQILNLTYAYGAEVMLALNPETPPEALRPWFGKIKNFQILSVYPGAAGQSFLPFSLSKIRFLREEVPDATIEVDGGITPEIAKKVKAAGADIITSSHYILAAHDPARAYEELAEI
jgi:ribulose-phosphate 3-epimerase